MIPLATVDICHNHYKNNHDNTIVRSGQIDAMRGLKIYSNRMQQINYIYAIIII